MNLKLFFGVLSIIPAAFAYFFYFRDMFAGKTKPHAFSWLIWGILAATGFFGQVHAHAGTGAWATGITSIASLTVFGFALRLGTTRPSQSDKIILTLALLGMLLLFVIHNKSIALCLTLFALIAGFVMTSRKAYHKPFEENLRSFILNTLKFVPAILALSSFSFLALAYPLVAMLGNTTVATVVYVRRKSLLDN